jgi:hypothetical protein
MQQSKTKFPKRPNKYGLTERSRGENFGFHRDSVMFRLYALNQQQGRLVFLPQP